MRTNIIFLDVDGVLNCGDTFSGPNGDGGNTLDPVMCDRFAEIVKKTGAIVVLSSTWRLFNTDKLKRWLGDRGVVIHSHTPRLPDNIRGDEIQKWLDDNSNQFPNPKFVILDDEPDMLPSQLPFLVQTNFKTGLLDNHVTQVVSLLT